MGKKITNHNETKLLYRNSVLIAAILLLILLLIFSMDEFGSSFSVISSSNIKYVLLGMFFVLFTFSGGALSYRSLSLKRINYRRLFIIEIANGFVSKLLPAGIGGLALHARFLAKNGHTAVQASTLAAVNNMVGFGSYLFLVVIAVFLSDRNLSESISFNSNLSYVWWSSLVFVTSATLITMIISSKLRMKTLGVLKQLSKMVNLFRKKPYKLFGSFYASLLITLGFLGALYFTAESLGVDLSILETFLVLTVGVSVASITPTPGGAGGAETGLAAALTAIGVPLAEAVSIALLYRLITFWIPIIPGLFAFRYVTKREYI